MGGEIGVDSELGTGTTFWFTLKLSVAKTKNASPSDLPTEPSSEFHPVKPLSELARGLHFLVAEDNEMNQFVTEEILRQGGCTCEIVVDGELAIEAVKKGQYSAVLMDCHMPNMNGLEASQRIRSWEQQIGAQRLPIIALTADALQGDREKCLAVGMDGYVTKPINAQELFAAINSVIVRINPSAASAESPPAQEDVSGAPIDVQALFIRCMNDNEFTTKMLEKFHLRASGDVDLIRSAFASGDIKAAARLAHNFKAVAAHAGAENLRKIAFEIEQAALQHELDCIQRHLDELAAEAGRCVEYVATAIARAGKLSPLEKSFSWKK
jgi:two-component system, sensor histidine kinase and response regulator